MTVRPPKAYSKDLQDPLSAALEQEIFNEKAGTLARLNRKLEEALARLPELDPDADEAACEKQDRLTAEAGEALWHVTIQRELCGLTRHKEFFDHMKVPRTVRLRMGPVLGKKSQDK
jgi:hypothetical protein